MINAKIEVRHLRTLFKYYFMPFFTCKLYWSKLMTKLISDVTLYPVDGFVIHRGLEAPCYVMLLANYCLQCLKQCNKWMTVLATGTF